MRQTAHDTGTAPAGTGGERACEIPPLRPRGVRGSGARIGARSSAQGVPEHAGHGPVDTDASHVSDVRPAVERHGNYRPRYAVRVLTRAPHPAVVPGTGSQRPETLLLAEIS